MSYPRQQSTIERIERETQRALKELRKAGSVHVRGLWEHTKRYMRDRIREIYRTDFGRVTWDLAMAARRGTFKKIDSMTRTSLDVFHHESIGAAGRYFREIYKQTVFRNAYALDMATPESYDVQFPKNRMFTEAAITTYVGPDAETAWKVRWLAWEETYQTALMSNLRLGAMNGSDVNDAENEVDATRAGSPAYDMGEALDRIFITQAIYLQSQAQQELSAVNEEMGIEEIWQTSFSARVCDTCDSQKGLTREESEEQMPAHPNCECYWRLVPESWADLLRSGNADEVDLAKWMDANGIVPSSMVIRNEDGEPSAKAMVTFDDWVKGMPKVAVAM